MSNRSNNNNNKGSNKTQKKFVAKPIANQPLTTALRDQTLETPITDSSSSATNRVRRGEDGSWVSSRSHGGSFVDYLPQDEAVATGLNVEDGALDPIESQRVVDLLNRELSRLLKSKPQDFWREVASNASLHDFLDSFLKFRSRWYDFPHHGVMGTVAGVIVGELELSRRVFMVLYRISSNRDPGARASDSLSIKEHTALLQEKKLLDFPKLLDICAIYGHENEKLTGELIMNAMKAQPMLHESIFTAVSQFLNIVHTMHQRCNSFLDALHSSGGHEDHRGTDISEVGDFINDAVASFHAFVSAYNPAALYFCCPVETSYQTGDMLSILARLHDSLLPLLLQSFKKNFTAAVNGSQNSLDSTFANICSNLKRLLLRIRDFGWKLIDLCYFSNGVFEGSFPISPGSKIFPFKVEDPGIRGDILVQTFREIKGDASGQVEGNNSSRTFLQNLEQNYGVLDRLNALRASGWIVMDEENFQYLVCIMRHPFEAVKEDFNLSINGEKSKVQIDEDAAIMDSKISQIKDLFPKYGKGFLAACLEIYNQNAEEVIQRILEGTLHGELQSLDISLDKVPPPKSYPSLSGKDKGKGILVEAPISSLSSKADDARTLQKQTTSSSSSLGGRYTRKSKVDMPDPRSLDSRGDKNSAKTAMLASQLEYEDEYDDSFDELGLSIVESGFEETENLGDKISSSSTGTSWGAESESSAPNNSDSKWGSRKKPQYYVKDGRNYSYKVSGAVAVANYQEATLFNQAQKETIYGLGRGGNLALGAAKALTEFREQQDHDAVDVTEMRGRGRAANARGRGRGRRGGGGNIPQGNSKTSAESNEKDQDASTVTETEETGGQTMNSRGRGRRGSGNHYKKDRAMKKHFILHNIGYATSTPYHNIEDQCLQLQNRSISPSKHVFSDSFQLITRTTLSADPSTSRGKDKSKLPDSTPRVSPSNLVSNGVRLDLQSSA
ncbi:hypothetical protein Sjap_022664 [Stephania japonica]|uniref:CUE domain-containing protein n=1 Tax=Stephania japonica TaxID=461633 RepID=A0AAP0HTV5_9MAGN